MKKFMLFGTTLFLVSLNLSFACERPTFNDRPESGPVEGSLVYDYGTRDGDAIHARWHHPQWVAQLQNAEVDITKLKALLRRFSVGVPRIFPAKKLADFDSLYHGTSHSNLLSMQRYGIGYASGHDGVSSGMFLTNSTYYAGGFAVRNVRQKRNLKWPQQIEAVGKFVIDPQAKVVDLTNPRQDATVPRIVSWMEEKARSGQLKGLLRGILPQAYLDQFLSSFMGENVATIDKQFVAHLFGANLMLVTPLYGQSRINQLVILDHEAVRRVEIQE